jgi:hypothetical protein
LSIAIAKQQKDFFSEMFRQYLQGVYARVEGAKGKYFWADYRMMEKDMCCIISLGGKY